MLQIFKFNDQEVRTVLKNNENWFVAKDVADALGYSSTAKMTARLDEGEVTVEYVSLPSKSGSADLALPSNNAAFISESGLYSAVLGSQKAEAKAFKKWVTSEVIPSIRRTGQYTLKDSPEVLNKIRARVEDLEAKYKKPAHMITPPVFGHIYMGPLQWHSIMYEMHSIAALSVNPMFAADKISTEYHKLCGGHITTYDRALEYLAEIRAQYEEGYDPALIAN